MASNPSDFKLLDEAASKIAFVLREAGVHYVFFGGYAASLIGGTRVSKDLNVIADRDTSENLRNIKELSWSNRDNCWIYTHRDEHVQVIVSSPGGPYALPSPDIAGNHIVYPDNLPERNLYAQINIIHPSVLILTKLQIWDRCFSAGETKVYLRTQDHLADIMATLEWLSTNKVKIRFNKYPDVDRNEIYKILRNLYRYQKDARPLMVASLSFNDTVAVMAARA